MWRENRRIFGDRSMETGVRNQESGCGVTIANFNLIF
jgi:hypothetical protein